MTFFGLELGPFFGAFMAWGFLISFLFNIFARVAEFKSDNSLLLTSGVMATSYLLSDHYFTFDVGTRVYSQWAIYDIVTIAAIFLLHFIVKIKTTTPCKYIYLGLTVNTLLFYFMHLDILVMQNKDAWWLWSLYSYGVNAIDYIMIITLIVGKDWLGLVRFGRFIRNKAIAKKERFIENQKEKRLLQA